MSDEPLSLEDRIRQGDAAALVAYLEAQRPPLLAYIRRRLGAALARKVEAEDIFQEMSVRAVAALPSLELGERDPFSWLCQVAEQRLIDAFRRFGAEKRDMRREVPIDAGSSDEQEGLIALLVASLTSPSMAVARDHRQQKLLEALERLPRDAREAIRLRYMENLPSKEIAEKLGKTDGAIRVLLTRSLQKLREILGSELAP